MTRSGIEATLRAVLYSGFFLKSEEFSSVEASSAVRGLVSGFHCAIPMLRCEAHLCKPARIPARMEGSTWLGGIRTQEVSFER